MQNTTSARIVWPLRADTDTKVDTMEVNRLELNEDTWLLYSDLLHCTKYTGY